MQIGTKVFERIVRESKEKALAEMVSLMRQTVRFGGFTDDYLMKCAIEIYENGDSKR